LSSWDKTATVKLESKEIWLDSPYDLRIVEAIREIPGRKWNSKASVWILPYTQYHAQRVIDDLTFFGFTIEPRIVRMAEKDKKVTVTYMMNRDNLFPFQSEAVDFVHKAQGRVILGDDMGCISGDAEIIVNRAGKGFRISLSQLYEKFNELSARYPWDKSIPTMTRSVLPTGALRLNKIVGVINKGIKPCLRIMTEQGKLLVLTADHEIYTPSGWVEARNLEVGSLIYTNGVSRCHMCGTTENVSTYPYAKFLGYCKSCITKHLRCGVSEHADKDGYILVTKMYQHPERNNNNEVRKHRLVYEAWANGYSFDDWCKIWNSSNPVDATQFKLVGSDDVHHVDGNKANNFINNLRLTSHVEHMRIHGEPNRLTEFMAIKEDIIVKIEDWGWNSVYDIQMEDPYNSFVANGIVVHNCGKTIEALGWIRERPELKSILIVCPASVVYKWANEIKKWVGENEPIEVITTGSQPLPSVRFLIMSYAIMVAQHQNLIRQEWDVLVLDEAHRVKDSKRQRSRCAKALQFKHCLLLTGTPMMNRPSELFSLLNMLNPVEWDNFFHYAQRYCAAKKTYFGWDFNGASNLNELRDRLKTYMIRRTKKEVLTQLPDLTRTRIPVEVKKHEIEEALKSLTQWVKENGHSNGGRAEAMVRLGKLRQAIGLAKVPIVLDMVEDILEQDESQKVVVYAVHHSVVQLLLEGLKKYGVSSITGETSQAERQSRIDNFQKRAMPRVMVISSAGGEGIDLYKADRILFCEREWTSGAEEQAEARCHRMGQKNAVEAIYLIATATVDRDMDSLIEQKREIFQQLIGSDKVSTIRNTVDEFLELVQKRGG